MVLSSSEDYSSETIYYDKAASLTSLIPAADRGRNKLSQEITNAFNIFKVSTVREM